MAKTPCAVCSRGVQNEYLVRGNKPPFKDQNSDNPIQPLCTIHKRKNNRPVQSIVAVTLLGYNFTSNLSPSTTGVGVSGSAMAGNAALTAFATASPGYATDPIVEANPPSTATTKALAVTNNSYFSFTISPSSGKKIGFTQMTFSAARINANTPTGYAVRSSIDNFAADIKTADLTTAQTTFATITVDLSAGQYQSLTTPVTFRIYVYAPAITDGADFDTFVLSGFVTAG